MRGLARVAASCLAAMACLASAQAGVPQGDYQTLYTEHFRFHYLPQDASAAHTLAAMAPSVHDYVIDTLAGGRDPQALEPGIVDVLLVSWTDIANGLSTQIPFNQIQVHLFPPRSFETLQSYRSWLETVFVHEYTHAVHIAMARGPTRWLRYVFGRSIVNGVQVSRSATASELSLWPVLPFFTGFPNQFLPSWNIEGLAVNVESWATGRGRLYAPQSREIMRNAATQGTLPRWSDLSAYGRTPWPYGTADYLYGAGFLGSLSRAQALGFQRTNALGLLPYLPWASFRAGAGLSLSGAWSDYHLSLRAEARNLAQNHNPEPRQRTLARAGDRGSLTSDGESVFWIERDGAHATQIVQAHPPADAPTDDWSLERFTARGAEWIAVNRDWIAAQVLDWPDRAQLRNRLVLWRRSDHQLVEPATGWQLVEPSLTPRNDIAAVYQDTRHSELRLGWIRPDGQIQWQPRAVAHSSVGSLHTPSLSPDGSRIAYVEHRGVTAHDLMIWDRASGRSRVLYSSAREELLPHWLDYDRLQFVSDRSGIFQIYELSVSTGVPLQRSHTPSGWYQTTVLGPHTLALRLAADGYRIVQVDSAALTSREPIQPEVPYVLGDMPDAATLPTPESDLGTGSYRPWRMLLPRAWTPIMYLRSDLLSGGDPLVGGAGVSLGSTDLLGRHRWNLSAASRFDTWQPEGTASYSYGGAQVDGSLNLSSYVPQSEVPDGTRYEARQSQVSLYASAASPRRTHQSFITGGVRVLDYATPQSGRLRFDDAGYFGRAGGPLLSLGWSSYTSTPRVRGPHNGFHLTLTPQIWVTHDARGQFSTLASGLIDAGTAWHLFARNRLAARIWAGASSGDVLRYRAFAISGDNWTLASGNALQYNSLSGISLMGLQVNQPGYRFWAYQYTGAHVGAFQFMLDQPLWMPERGWANLIWFQGLRLNGYFEGALMDVQTLVQPADWTLPPTVGVEIESSWAFVDSIGLRFAMGYWGQPATDRHQVSFRARLGL